MMNFNNLTIRKKIIGIILLTTTVILMIGFSFVISNEIITSKKELIDKSLVEARFIGEYCVVYLSFNDRDGAEDILKKAESIPTIEAVGVYDENNKLFAKFNRSDQEIFLPEPKTEVFSQFHKDHLDIFYPINFDKQFYGTIYLHVSTETLSQKINNFVVLLLLLIIALVTISYFVANKLQKIISRPILDLAYATKKISEGEDYSLKVQKKSNDEIGVLIDGFNNMMDQIHVRQKARDEAEEAWRVSENSLAEAQRVAHIGNWNLDLVKNELQWSDEIYRIFDLKPQEFGVTYETFLDAIHPDDREMVNKTFTESVRNKIPYDIIHRLLMKDGIVKYVNEIGETFYDDGGKPVCSVGIMQDITERKQAEDELKKYRKQLEKLVRKRTDELEKKTLELEQTNIQLQESDRLKSVFLANMSHELRTPLNSIIGFTGMILMGIVGDFNAEQKKQLTMVKNSAHHLLNLINDILDISKIESGKTDIFPEEFYINDVIQEVVNTVTPLVNEKRIELLEEIAEKTLIISDRKCVKQILMNLVGNAVKFTDQGSVKIESGVLKNEDIEIRVIDTGTGIRKEDVSNLFEMFKQVDMSSTKKHEGTGLGLYLSMKLVTLLGGDITVKSEYGRGSEFTVNLPLKYKEAK